MKTAIQELIDDLIELDKQLDNRRKSEDSTIFKMSPNKLYKKALEKEKEQIKDAWDAGMSEGIGTMMADLDWDGEFVNYYKETYGE